ncbi:L-lactate dehydrogenase [Methylobacterium komagatae]|uniref:L-lactate dehydrogenase n=1 Tax=Methylobacterium komagatae TaxID=374425 RepID=A0ABW2BLP7_9HYPH
MDPTITTIEDLRRIAKRRVPRMFYDYADSGSWTEGTYRANEADFAAIQFRQRVAVDMTDRSLATTMAGQRVAMPVALAPTGMTGMQHADGEILAARAAEAAGVPFTLSTMSICSIEDVAEAVSSPFWFQLYFMRDRAFNDRLIDRAAAAGCSALVLTLDLQILGQRHKDIRNGLSAPPRLTPSTVIDLLTKPRWCLGMARTQRRTFRNIVGHVEGVGDTRSISAWTSQQFDPRLDWDDVARIRDRWKGPLILKGILDAEDAEKAVATGAESLIVSNHGGRQLDGAPSSIAILPEIVESVGSRIEVLMDGGIRSGQDVLKAIALGAKGVFIGRPFLYGLGAGGEAGVARCLEIIRKELDMTMALCGHRNLLDVDRSILRPPHG